jgi:hypothetical protein
MMWPVGAKHISYLSETWRTAMLIGTRTSWVETVGVCRVVEARLGKSRYREKVASHNVF